MRLSGYKGEAQRRLSPAMFEILVAVTDVARLDPSNLSYDDDAAGPSPL
jgi:hypothetical protein